MAKIRIVKDPAWRIKSINRNNSGRSVCVRISHGGQSIDLFDCEFFNPTTDNDFLDRAPLYIHQVALIIFDGASVSYKQLNFIDLLSCERYTVDNMRSIIVKHAYNCGFYGQLLEKLDNCNAWDRFIKLANNRTTEQQATLNNGY